MKPWVPIAAAVIVGALVGAVLYDRAARISPSPNLREPPRIAAGKSVYDIHCASCHGGNLEGQPNWTSRLPNGRMPAPPHDDSGHTWHHSNEVLFALAKYGMKPPYAPAGIPKRHAGVRTDFVRRRHLECARLYPEPLVGSGAHAPRSTTARGAAPVKQSTTH